MFRPLLIALLCACALPAATLERLSLEDLIAASTAIVRGKIHATGSAFHGSVIYTQWKVSVAERWKGPSGGTADFLVPGGVTGGFRQTVAGAPALAEGKEYLLFLWTSRTGATYITGLSQGVFDLPKDAADELMATRPAAAETMLDSKSWRPVKDEAISMRFADMSARIAAGVANGAGH